MTDVINIDHSNSHSRTLQFTLMRQAPLLKDTQSVFLERTWRPVNDLPSPTHQIVEEVADDMDVLLEGYHALVDLELSGTLPPADIVRLRDVEAQLDELDANDPIEQAIDERMQTVSNELDSILGDIQRLFPSP